jgi:hypothetical protein
MKKLFSELLIFSVALGIVYLMYWTLTKIHTFLFD